MWRRAEGSRGGRRPSAAAGLLALLVALVGCDAPAGAGDLRGSPMPQPIPMPELTLTDTEGRTVDVQEAVRGQVTLVFFGFTNCPDICPVHMATLGAAYDELEPEVRDAVRVLFVSTDPERDTPEVIRSWLDGHHRDFVGLRGELDEINRALAGLLLPGVAVLPSEGHDEGPMIGHPSAVVAFDRRGRARLRYPFGTRRADWLHDLPRLVADF